MKRRGIVWLCSLLFLFAACAPCGRNEVLHSLQTRQSVSVVRDSIYLRDSVFVARRADTVFYEKSRILYRDRWRVDTFIARDTLFREKTVTVEKVVTKYPSPWLLLSVVMLFYVWHKGWLRWLWVLLKNLIK